MRSATVLVALALAAAVSIAQPPVADPASDPAAEAELALALLTFTVTPEAATIGDRLLGTLTFTSLHPLEGAPRFPVWEEHWGDADVLAVTEPADLGNGVWRQELTLAMFETGLLTLPAPSIDFTAGGVLHSVTAEAPAIVEVESVLPEGEEEPAPQAPAAPRELPVGESFWWTATAFAVGCLVLGWLLFRAARSVARTLAALQLTPFEALERALTELRSQRGGERTVAALSLEFRRYLGRSIGFPAAEGTTSQIQRELRRRQLPSELLRPSIELLHEADKVKFARAPIDAARAEARIEDVARLAAEVETWLAPEPEPESEPAAEEAA